MVVTGTAECRRAAIGCSAGGGTNGKSWRTRSTGPRESGRSVRAARASRSVGCAMVQPAQAARGRNRTDRSNWTDRSKRGELHPDEHRRPSADWGRYAPVLRRGNKPEHYAETDAQQVVASSGNFTSIYCAVSAAPGTGNSWAFQLNDNAAACRRGQLHGHRFKAELYCDVVRPQRSAPATWLISK